MTGELEDLPHTADVKRLAQIGATGKRANQTVITAMACFIQPMSAQAEATYGMAIGTGFIMFANEADNIRSGDQIVSGDKTYGVQGVQYFDYGTPHYEVILSKEVR